jgi:hypothetical protein
VSRMLNTRLTPPCETPQFARGKQLRHDKKSPHSLRWVDRARQVALIGLENLPV